MYSYLCYVNTDKQNLAFMKTIQITNNSSNIKALKVLGYDFKIANLMMLNVAVPNDITPNKLLKQLKSI